MADSVPKACRRIVPWRIHGRTSAAQEGFRWIAADGHYAAGDRDGHTVPSVFLSRRTLTIFTRVSGKFFRAISTPHIYHPNSVEIFIRPSVFAFFFDFEKSVEFAHGGFRAS